MISGPHLSWKLSSPFLFCNPPCRQWQAFQKPRVFKPFHHPAVLAHRDVRPAALRQEAVPRFLTELGFADFMTRRGMDGKTRELLTVVILAAMGGAEVQVRSHVEGALKAGNTKEEVVCALVHAMPYMGIPRLFNALNCSKELLSE